ncbi:SMI1/KNR4 family protein [Niallia taxi]|uniref:SMI1/KNR4 family protein n=1 Tax=Niallia taxi TaxID=2499688 RepID=UPI00317F1A77
MKEYYQSSKDTLRKELLILVLMKNITELERILNVKLPKSYKEYPLTFGYGGIFGRYILGLEELPHDGSVIDATVEYLHKGLPSGFVIIEDVQEFIFVLIQRGKYIL